MKKRALIAATAVLLGLGSALVAAGPANAYTLIGCKMPSTSVTVKNSAVLSKLTIATANAHAAWSAEVQPVNFVVSTASTAKVFVTTISAVDNYYAVTSGTCSGGTYSGQVTMTWNSTGVAGLNAAALKKIAVHEFGHALGLGHMTATCSSTKTVMVQGTIKWTCPWGVDEPWADDVAGANFIY